MFFSSSHDPSTLLVGPDAYCRVYGHSLTTPKTDDTEAGHGL
jgi:hypothetical protein